MPINDNFLQELKYKTDIEDIISTYVSLKKRGATSIGLCPFHNEKTPSFTVYPDTQSFYCFGCGAGGDATTFIKKIENLDYIDAIKYLAERAGLQMPQDGFDDSLSKKRRRILEVNRATAKFYHAYMMSENGKKGLEYFLNRGLTSKTITKFGLGFAPDNWDTLLKHLKSSGYTIGEMADAGVIKKTKNNSYIDMFRNRVMTPIIDVRGNVIAFGGRVLDDSKPKYINTGDTLAYKKTNELFALNLAKDSGKDTIILSEGYMDVISMHQAGFNNAVAGCGTALTPEQVRLISRYAKEVILAYDADEAGQKAVQKAMTLFSQTDLKVRIPNFVGGKDPDEIIKTYGRDKFAGMLEGASNEIEFKLLKIRNTTNLLTTQGKIDYINSAIKILAETSPVEQDLYVSRIAEELGVEKQNIKIQLNDYKKKIQYSRNKNNYKKIVNDNIRENVKQSYENDASVKKLKSEERLIALLLKYPDRVKDIGDFDSKSLTEGFTQKVFKIICTNINNGLDTDLINFGEFLTDSEKGRLSGIVARTKESANPKKEFSDCLNIIQDEYNKKNSDVESLSNDDFRKLFGNT